MGQKNILVCFTASFPYGLKETFFENELPYIAEAFDEVIIFPKYNPSKSSEKRSVPGNVICVEPLVSSSKLTRIIQGILNTSPVSHHLKDFFKQRVYSSKDKFMAWMTSVVSFRKSYQVVKRFLSDSRLPNHTVMYSYWAETPLFVTKLFQPYKKVVRMHRSDFYVEEKKGGYLALRQETYDAADCLTPISLHISDILVNDYRIKQSKIHLSRLGVSNEAASSGFSSIPKPKEGVIRIVSCSRVDPVKRVDLIADSLRKHEGSEVIEWHHFGDGLQFENLKRLANELNKKKNIRIILHSWMTQAEIFDFYRSHAVTWLVNVSESEGIPVSIMEAMSFGIPIIATDVGGSSEIVNCQNGFLLQKEFDVSTLLNYILDCKSEQYKDKRDEAYRMWKEQYQAESNYTAFSTLLRKLADDNQQS